LDKYAIPYSVRNNNCGVPMLYYLKSPFKNYLTSFGGTALTKHMTDEIFHLPLHKIMAILNGYCDGDGHWTTPQDKKPHRFLIYNTISDQLASDLCRLHFILNRPLYKHYCDYHGGLGKHPIWRLYEETNGDYTHYHGYDGISEVSLSRYDAHGYAECRDIEIKDTHVFFFENGVMSHNCDCQATLTASMLKALDIPARMIMVAQYSKQFYNHIYTEALVGKEWATLETTRKVPYNTKPQRVLMRGIIPV